MASEYQDLEDNINSRLFEEKRKLQESMDNGGVVTFQGVS